MSKDRKRSWSESSASSLFPVAAAIGIPLALSGGVEANHTLIMTESSYNARYGRPSQIDDCSVVTDPNAGCMSGGIYTTRAILESQSNPIPNPTLPPMFPPCEDPSTNYNLGQSACVTGNQQSVSCDTPNGTNNLTAVADEDRTNYITGILSGESFWTISTGRCEGAPPLPDSVGTGGSGLPQPPVENPNLERSPNIVGRAKNAGEDIAKKVGIGTALILGGLGLGIGLRRLTRSAETSRGERAGSNAVEHGDMRESNGHREAPKRRRNIPGETPSERQRRELQEIPYIVGRAAVYIVYRGGSRHVVIGDPYHIDVAGTTPGSKSGPKRSIDRVERQYLATGGGTIDTIGYDIPLDEANEIASRLRQKIEQDRLAPRNYSLPPEPKRRRFSRH